jgi:hypothetical protein
MTLGSMRTALSARLATVPGVGRVYPYFRLVDHAADVRADYVADRRLHVWFVTLADDEPFIETRHVGCSRVRGRFWLHGYYALADAGATEQAFESIMQSVIDTFRPDAQFAGAAIDSGPLRVKEYGHRTFCDVVCHYVQAEIDVWAQVENES